jgi:hypothetical protein
MIPRGAEGVEHLSTRILADLVPKTSDAYTAADLGMLAALVSMIGQDYDRAAEVLASDCDDICEILCLAKPHIGDAQLKRRMTSVLTSPPNGFRVHQLSARADDAMKVLIDLQEAVETAQDDGASWAAPLNHKIWTFLESYVARRVYEAAF